MDGRKVFVTGVGFACPLGIGSRDVFARIVAGENGILDVAGGHPVGLVHDFDPVEMLGSRKTARRNDRVANLAAAATIEALADAELDPSEYGQDARNRMGVIMGTGIGGISTLLAQHVVMLERGEDRVSPLLIPMFMPNAAGAFISMRYGLGGPNTTVTTACAAGAHAVGDAAVTIASGLADVMIAGGAESCIEALTLSAFRNLGALTRSGSRPFDLNRDGFVMSEGSGILVLESDRHARARGAEPICEVAGYGRTADAHHITAPHPRGDGAVRAIEMALDLGQIERSEVGYVNAHGTSTQLNDKAEVTALERVFGDDIPPVSSTKSMTGHLIGAAGGLEAGITALALANEVIPPTINYETPDPEIDVDVVPNEAREAPGIEVALSESFGFGGHNAVLAFRRV